MVRVIRRNNNIKMTPRELVLKTLEFGNKDGRAGVWIAKARGDDPPSPSWEIPCRIGNGIIKENGTRTF
jgi:hypothetical protein